jgi:hypothetical protein
MPSPPFGTVGGESAAEVGWTTYTLADAAGSSDPNAIASGAGWHMSGSRIQFETTSQATLRDGWNEGAYQYWRPPATFRYDGTQAMVFCLDDWTFPNAASGVGLGIAILSDTTPWTIGVGLGLEDQAAGAKRTYEILPAIRSQEVTNTGVGMYRLNALWMPGLRNGAFEIGNLSSTTEVASVGSAGTGYAHVSNGSPSPVQPLRLCLVGTWNTTTAGRVQIPGARFRSRVVELTPAAGWV